MKTSDKYDEESKIGHVNWIKILLLGYMSFPLTTLVFFIINSNVEGVFFNSYHIANVLLVFHVFVISYIGYANQDVIVNPIKSIKRSNSNLSSINPAHVENQLGEILESKKLYLDRSLTLTSLSQELDITTHQLSEYLNREKKQSFNDYINGHRIEYAKSLLIGEEGEMYTLDGIAEKSGFNSLSTFHRNFKKHTGLTPKQWNKNQEPIS